MPAAAPRFLRLYLCFAPAYVLSYTYRTVNAVISPELTTTLGALAYLSFALGWRRHARAGALASV